MAFYTSSIHSKEIEPIFHTNYRTEFRLSNPENPLYLSSFRLCDVGCTMSGNNQELNRGAGILSMIKRVEILDGNVSLENLTNFNYWAAFRQQNRTNDVNMSQASKLSGNQMGFVNDNNQGLVYPSGQYATTSELTTFKGWVSLRDFMAFLSDSNEVPCSVFKDLRLVIEYETDPKKISPGTNETITGIVRPFLVVDEVVNQDLKKQREGLYQGVTFRPMESLNVYSPEITGETFKSYTLTGFNNKTIQRLLIMKAPTTTVSAAYGALSSVHFLSPSTNLIVNGSQLLPQELYTIAQEMSSVSESWGDCNIPYLGAKTNAANDTIIPGGAARVGWQSYINFDVNQYSRELVLKINRGFVNNGYYSQGINIVLFAEVLKRVMVNPDKTYNLMYV